MILVIAVIQYREFCLQTDYPKKFTQERFQQVTKGTSADALFDQLGFPFMFRVPALGDRGYFSDLAGVRPILFNGTDEVVLEYSRPREGDVFRARQIIVVSGRVVKVDAYDYWGD
jgi:hypothetical protein